MTEYRRLRVGYCVDSFRIGGTELNAIRTLESLDRGRFELCVVHLQEDGPLRTRYEALDVQMRHVPIRNLYSFATAAQGRRLASFWRSWGADVVHAHDVYTNVFCVPWSRMLGGCPVIASRRWWKTTARPGLAAVNRFSYRFANRVLANCDAVGRLLIEEEGVPARKVAIIPNFVSDRAFAPASAGARGEQWSAWGVPSNAFVVGIVARLVPVKNHQLLLRAAAQLDESVHIVVVGDGPLRPDLERMARELGISDRVHFLGELLTQDNVHAFFDVTALCSTSEGFPNAVVEALASARAVVATPVGGVTDVIVDGETGLLVAQNAPTALAHAIGRLREDETFRIRLGDRGQRAVRQRYHQRVVIHALSTLYEDLALGRAGS